MVQPQALQIEFKDTVVPGVLHIPQGEPPAEGFPALLLCDDPLERGGDAASLLEDIALRLLGTGMVVAHLDRTAMTASEGGNADLEADALVDQVSALYRAVALRQDVDLDRIGLLGYSLGAILALRLMQRTNHIARCCFLSPRTTRNAAPRPNGGSNSRKAERPDEPASRLVRALMADTGVVDLAGGERPLLIVQGAADRSEPPESSLAYLEATGSGPAPEHIFIARGDHAYASSSARKACLSQIVAFFTPLLTVAGSTK